MITPPHFLESKKGQLIALDKPAPGSSVVLLIHGRDGLRVGDNGWVDFEITYLHLKKILVVSEDMRRIASDILTG